MAPDLSTPTLGALAVVEDEFGRLRADLRQVNLVLAFLAHPMYGALADLAQRRAVDLKGLVDLLGDGPASALSISLGRLTARRLGVALRLSLRERSRLAFAAASQLLDDLLQLSDPALLPLDPLLLLSDPTPLLGDPASELRVLLKEFLVSWHV
jgi:hypothetical protein